MNTQNEKTIKDQNLWFRFVTQIKKAAVDRGTILVIFIISSAITTVFNFILFSVRDASTYSSRIAALEELPIKVEAIEENNREMGTDIKIMKEDVKEIKETQQNIYNLLIKL